VTVDSWWSNSIQASAGRIPRRFQGGAVNTRQHVANRYSLAQLHLTFNKGSTELKSQRCALAGTHYAGKAQGDRARIAAFNRRGAHVHSRRA